MGMAMLPLSIKSSATSELVPFTDRTNTFMIRASHALLSANVNYKNVFQGVRVRQGCRVKHTDDKLTTLQNINGHLI